jgi:hypothetical protein
MFFFLRAHLIRRLRRPVRKQVPHKIPRSPKKLESPIEDRKDRKDRETGILKAAARVSRTKNFLLTPKNQQNPRKKRR